MAGRPVSLALRPPMLAGREELLAGLRACLSGYPAAGPTIIALHGLAGAGKTSVAVEYAHRHQATAGVVWQFPAEDRAVLTAEFGRLAGQLGVGGGLLDRRDPVASVHAVLAAAATPWLLVFDNAPDLESVRAFLPSAGTGLVLITSQSALWPPGQSVEIPVLGTGAAAGFLTARTGDPDERAARQLAAELGGLPLALEQAAAYIHATADSLAGYLALFRLRRAELLGRGEPTGYGKTVASTWALAFDRLMRTEHGAVGLLRLLAFCAPEAVPVRLLLQPRPELAGRLGTEVTPVLAPLLEDPLAASDAIAALRRYSLVTPAPGGSVSLHRLVQAVTADQMPPDLAGQWRLATAALIGAAIPAEPWIPGTWPVYEELLPHVQAAASADSAAAAAIADYLGYSGSYPVARDSMKRVVEARQRTCGPEHPDTLIARCGLALWTGEAGDAATAHDQVAGLLPVAERVLGPENLHTLFIRRQLAWWTGEAGDAAAARDQWAALVPVCERVLGPEHPETLTVRQGLAAVTGRAGDAAAARDQLADLLPSYERVLGAEHPETLTTREWLADWARSAAGDPRTTDRACQ
jgi:Tetratricopeptide repeat